MSIPTTVSKRAENNDFVATTGMLLTGVTGFAYRTGFYLTNSGSHEIETTVTIGNSNQEFFNFPSGQNFLIAPGKNQFIPFDFVSVGPNQELTYSGPSSGPYFDGRVVETFRINSMSTALNTADPSGSIRILVSGQVSGFGSLPLDAEGNIGTGPATSNRPMYPNNFKVVYGVTDNGRQRADLRWDHPSTGYYFTRYQIERCENLTNDSSSATGTWAVADTFGIGSEVRVISDPIADDFNFKQYGTNTGISQRYSTGTINNQLTAFGEYSDETLFPNTEYSYRIKGQYQEFNGNIPNETDYVYAYKVSTFTENISNATIRNDVANGLISGSDSLNDNADVANVVHTTDPAGPMIIQLSPGVDDNVELSAKFDEYINANLDGDKSVFNAGATQLFTGVHFVIPEGVSIGSKEYNADDTPKPAIEYSTAILDTAGTPVEIPTALIMNQDSRIIGLGGKGGNGGFTRFAKQDSDAFAKRHGRSFRVDISESVESTKGLDGGVGLDITGNTIAKFTLRMHPTAKIFGGGGGGGGGDTFFIPKAFSAVGPSLNMKGWAAAFTNSHPTVGSTTTAEGKTLYHLSTFVTRKADAVNAIAERAAGDFADTYSRGSIIGDEIKISFDDITQMQKGGVGGGGRGFGISDCGKVLHLNPPELPLARNATPKDDPRYGNSEGGGTSHIFEGLSSDPRRITNNAGGNNIILTVTDDSSIGGFGADYGEDGGTQYSFSATSIFRNTGGQNNLIERFAKMGGMGGPAVRLSTGNSNYSNLSKLQLSLNYKEITKANFPSLIAYFDASQKVYSAYTDESTNTPATDGGSVLRWNSAEDPTTIYLEMNDANHRPIYRTDATITDYFNSQPTVFFDGGKTRHGFQYFGLKSDRPRIADQLTEEFEIFYYLAPYLPTFPARQAGGTNHGIEIPFLKKTVEFLDNSSGYGLYGSLGNAIYGLWKTNNSAGSISTEWQNTNTDMLSSIYKTNTSNPYDNATILSQEGNHNSKRVGPVGWGLHNFTVKSAGFINYTDDTANEYGFAHGPHQKFYAIDGTVKENIGLPSNQIMVFDDITGSSSGVKRSIGRAWMYSVAAQVNGDRILYSVYNNGVRIAQDTFVGSKLNFLEKPVIGMSTAGSCFYGMISDIGIFNKKLSNSERMDVYNSLIRRKNKVYSSATFTVTANKTYSSDNITKVKPRSGSFSINTSTKIEENSIIMFPDGFIKGVDEAVIGATRRINGFYYGKINEGDVGTVYPPYRNKEDINDNFAGYILGPSTWYQVQK